jgi:hypothetical protein
MSSPTDEPSGGPPPEEPADALGAAFSNALGTTDFEIVAEVPGRLPSGEEVRLVHAVVPGQPNRTASLAVDAAGAVHPRRRLEALGGRDLFTGPVPAPAAAAPAATAVASTPAVAGAGPVTVHPPANELVLGECSRLAETVTVNVPVSGARPRADVYLLADTTGSMGPILDAVKTGIAGVVAAPAFAGFDVAWGAGDYKDFPVPEEVGYAFRHQLSPTPGAADVASAVATWTAYGGNDTPEGQLYALQQVATDPAIGWRPDSRRIVVWFGDAPGHDPVCAAMSGVPDITEPTATEALGASHITVVAISTDTGVPGALDGDPTLGSTNYGVCGVVGGTAGQATRIAEATPGGSHTAGVDAASIVATLVDLVAEAVGAIGNLSLRPGGDAAAFVGAISPAGGFGPLPGDEAHTLPFEVSWAGAAECGDEDRLVTGSLDVVADGTVVASKPVTVTVPACRWHHPAEVICGKVRDERHDRREGCRTLAEGRYATAIVAYNPHPCPVTVEKRFAPLVLEGRVVGREPETQPARTFVDRLILGPGEAVMDDCCALEEAVGPSGGRLLFGVLDLVADRPLEVTATYTVANGGGAPAIDVRTITARRA